MFGRRTFDSLLVKHGIKVTVLCDNQNGYMKESNNFMWLI